MKKLLTLTILLTTFIQADEEANKNTQNVCFAMARDILEQGLAPCKENDILLIKTWGRETGTEYENKRRYLICKRETITANSCLLRAEKDFGYGIEHRKIKTDERAKKWWGDRAK